MQIFKKTEVLKNKKLIESLFRNGSIIETVSLKFIWELQGSSQDKDLLKTLISIPKRNIRLSSKRNMMKRKVRELLRKKEEILIKKLEISKKKINLAIIYKERETCSYKVLDEKITLLLSTLIKNI
tara:strand:+ start:92 stop:469 length:378 start_codon:yes stop_codon:yes gene_type:complete